MFKMANGLKGQANHRGSQSTKIMRLAGLVGGLILISVAVNVLTIMADSNLRLRSSSDADHCSQPSYKAARPACRDDLGRRLAAYHFRDANAPLLNSSL
jgi:hypothetical protein